MFDKEYLNSLYKYCFALTADEHKAYDLLQMSIEKFLKIDSDAIENKRAYMRKTIRNQFIDIMRKQAKFDEEEFDDTVTYVDMDISSLENLIADRFDVEAIWQKLTPSEREIMYFWAVEGYTTSELSEMIGISRGTLLSKIYRLRKRLEKDIGRFDRNDVI